MKKKIEYGVYVMGSPQRNIPGGVLVYVTFTVNGISVANSKTLGM